MNVSSKRFCHFRTSNIRNRMQSETIVDFVHLVQVLPYRIDDQSNQIRILVHQ